MEFRDVLYRIAHLKRGNTAYGPAPHKPILLLTLFQMMDNGLDSNNQFPITEDLVELFRINWQLLVTTGHTPDFTQPFYHLKNDLVYNERLWNQKTYDGNILDKPIKSFNFLRSIVAYGYFHPKVFLWLSQPELRKFAVNEVLQTYFKNNGQHFFDQRLRKKCLTNYDKLVEGIQEKESVANDSSQKDNYHQENHYIRGGVFKKLVPRAYNYTCAISKMKVITQKGDGLIEACHIKPLSDGGPDHITNGIALCPNLHTAFDKGLITVDEQLRVVVSGFFEEDKKSDYGIKKFHGLKITLPFGKTNYPALEFFEYHRINIFINH